MKDEELLTFFDIHKEGNLHITHPVNVKIFSAPITLEDLYRMFKLKMEKESGVTYVSVKYSPQNEAID